MTKQKTLAGSLLVVTFFVAIVVYQYRIFSNFGFVMVRCSPENAEPSSFYEVGAVSPWKSVTPMRSRKDLVWRIPQDTIKSVAEIRIHAKTKSTAVQKKWEISISPTLTPMWTVANVATLTDDLVLTLPREKTHGSLIPSRSNTLNWLGDWRFIFRAAIDAILALGIGYVCLKLLWKSRLWWLKRSVAIEESTPLGVASRAKQQCVNVCGSFMILVILAFGIVGLWQMSKTLWPGLHWDGVYFSTPILNLAAGRGNGFAVYTHALMIAPGASEVDSHGQLYQGIVGAIIPKADYAVLLRYLHIGNLVAFVMAFAAFSMCACRTLKTSWRLAALIALPGAYATVSVLLYLQGRPEHGIPFVLLAFAIVRELLSQKSLPAWLQGIMIGLVAAISPLPGAVLGISSVFAAALWILSPRRWVLAATTQFMAAAAAWAISTAFVYDGPLLGLIANTARSGGGDYGGRSWFPGMSLVEWGVMSHWVNLGLAPCLAVVFGLCFLIGTVKVLVIFVSKECIGGKLIIASCSVPMVFLAWFYGVTNAGLNYNVVAFLPSICFWMLQTISDFHAAVLSRRSREEKSLRKFQIRSHSELLLPSILAASLVLPGLGLVRASWLQAAIAKSGVSFDEVQLKIANLVKTLRPDEVIMIDAHSVPRSPVVLDSPPWKFRSLPPGGDIENGEKRLNFSARYYLVLQASPDPPEIPGFVLSEDSFTIAPPESVWPLHEFFTPGYGYALYRRLAPNR